MNIQYVTATTPELRAQAADLIDFGEQLAQKLDRKKFTRSTVIVVALDANGRLVGASAVKERKGSVAEMGYLIVHSDCRGHGIATELTRRRIEAAKAAGLDLLISNVHRDNVASTGNLRKAGFACWGDFMSAYGTGHVISWFFLPLRNGVDHKAHLQRLTGHLQPAVVAS